MCHFLRCCHCCLHPRWLSLLFISLHHPSFIFAPQKRARLSFLTLQNHPRLAPGRHPKDSSQHLTYAITLLAIMCIKVIERYAVCRCLYYSHAVDPCPSFGRHEVKLKEVLVGYTCSNHSVTGSQPSTQQPMFPDSGYSSGGYGQRPPDSRRYQDHIRYGDHSRR